MTAGLELVDHDVPARDAATVILVRDGVEGLEVFLQHRVSSMAFAPGMTVFPGGGVDPSDATRPSRWFGPEPGEVAATLDVSEERSVGWICAAVRETFEECGVLLAGADAHDVVIDTAPMAQQRVALGRHGIALAALLDGSGLGVRSDLLFPVARWVTPRGERRRYDTLFLAAVLPPEQAADAENTEVTHAGWRRPVDALADWCAGKVLLMPPTWSQLTRLAALDSTAGIAGGEVDLAPVEPRIVDTDAGRRVDFPGCADYYRDLPTYG